MHWVAVINSKALILFSLSGLLLISSCEKNIAAGDKLSADELQYIRDRAKQKCLKESNSAVEDFIEASNDRMFDFALGKTWKISHSKTVDSGSAVEIDKSFIYVWKKTATKVYFRYEHVVGSTTTNKFFSVDAALNTDLIEKLQDVHCTKGLKGSSVSSTLIKGDIEADRKSEGDEYVEVTTSYAFNSKYPAYWGEAGQTITKKYFKNNSSTSVTKKEVFTRTISEVTTTDQDFPYTLDKYKPRQYCGMNYAAGPVYNFPLDLKCSADNADVTPWDINGDGSIELDPAAEL